jgi:microcystin-dependent protein
MIRLALRVTLLGLILGIAPQAAQAQAQPFVGQLAVFGFDFCPAGWLPADGRLLQIGQNQALFALIGTTYGGDGMTTFALPKWGPVQSNGTTSGVSGAMIVCIATLGVFPSQN